jgi:signal transduction histidine kinase/CheY-like chemotaxis protein
VRRGLFIKYVGLFVAIVSFALLINGASDIWFSYREQKALLFRIQRTQAESAAQKISQFFKEITAALAWETQLSWSDNAFNEWQIDAVRLLHQVPALTEIIQLDATGQEQFRMSRQGPDIVGSHSDHSKDAAFVQAVANKVYYGPVYFINGSEPYMTIAMAGVRPEFGVIVGKVNLTFIWDVVSQIRVGKNGQAYVVDNSGRLIAHPDLSLVLRKTDMSQLAHIGVAQSGRWENEPLQGLNIKGQHVLSAYAEVAPLGWLIFAELPLAEAYAPLYESAFRSIALVAVALVLACCAGLILARRMVVPISMIGRRAAQIGGGDLTQRISIHTGDELEELGEQFNRMAERLQESYATLERKVEERTRQLKVANEAKSRFLATASHDLRQPLHALGLFVAQLHGRTRAEDRRRIISGIEAALSGMNELFNGLLDISKLDAGATAPNTTDFPIANLLKRIRATFADAAQEKGLALRIVETSAWVQSDFILMERIVLNLVSNAIRYTSTGKVLIGCRRVGAYVRLEIWDTGSGIPEDQRQNIFSEFYRLGAPDQDKEGGLGLGLAIVDRLCRLLDHSLELRSSLGKGSCFSITVPAVAGPIEPLKTQGFVQPRFLKSESKLVVVIDDDPLVLESMGGLIRSWGCRVVTGNTDKAVLDELSQYKDPANLIISDYHLRDGGTGINVIARLREALGAPIPALLMSGDTDADPLHEALANGYVMLHKPVEPDTLFFMLSETCNKRSIEYSRPLIA